MSNPKSNLDRRAFLQTGAMAAVAAGALPHAMASEKAVDPKKVLNHHADMRYRRLGDTDMYLSVVSLGGLVMEPPVHHYAIEHGVNLVHISTSYLDGRSIEMLGEVLKTRREQVYLAIKDNFEWDKFDDVLKTLNTDYVDFMMFNIHDREKVTAPKYAEAFEKWKAQGKVRYAGLTSHDDVKAATAAGIDCGRYTLVNPAMNQQMFEELQPDLKAAREKKVGVMAMKSMRRIEGLDMQTAHLKKVLSNPAITTVVKGIGSFEMFDAYQKACQETLTSMEDRALRRYALDTRSENCMMCGECKRSCPDRVEVSTVLRCKDYYYEQMGDVETARTTYGAVPHERLGNSACEQCRKCEAVCPNGIKIVERLRAAHETFARLA